MLILYVQVIYVYGIDCFSPSLKSFRRFDGFSITDVCVQVQWVTGMGVGRHLSVIVNAPSGLIVGSVDETSGEIAFNAKETGE